MTDEPYATHSANEHMPLLLFSGAATRIQGSSRRSGDGSGIKNESSTTYARVCLQLLGQPPSLDATLSSKMISARLHHCNLVVPTGASASDARRQHAARPSPACCGRRQFLTWQTGALLSVLWGVHGQGAAAASSTFFPTEGPRQLPRGDAAPAAACLNPCCTSTAAHGGLPSVCRL